MGQSSGRSGCPGPPPLCALCTVHSVGGCSLLFLVSFPFLRREDGRRMDNNCHSSFTLRRTQPRTVAFAKKQVPPGDSRHSRNLWFLNLFKTRMKQDNSSMLTSSGTAMISESLPHSTVNQLHSNHTASQYIQFAEKNMVAGGIAGCIGKTLTAPLSRLTILYQVGPLLHKSSNSSHLRVKESLWSTLRSIVREEGLKSLWKGNFTSVIHRFPYSAVNFASFEVCKEQMEEHLPDLEHRWVRLIAGAFSGAASCFVCYPLDIVRTRLTVGIANSPVKEVSNSAASRLISSSKILEIWAEILQKEGYRGMYRGLTASLAVAVPTYAVSFTAYGFMKDTLLKIGGVFVNKKNGHLSAVGSLLSGSISGVVSSTLIFPLDVVRKRLQVGGLLKSHGNQGSSILKEIALIYGAEGVRGFYRGLMAEALKVCPMVALTFCSFELIKDALHIYLP